jgi:DNA-binding NarL/FixJ family response regulator
MLSKLINIGIVDDHTLFRKTLKNYLSDRNLNVVIQSPDIPDLLSKLKQTQIQILLMDIFMPKLNGDEAVKIIQEAYPEIKILILSMCTDLQLLSDLLDSGVYGIFSKADEPEELIHAIVSLSDEKIYRSKLLTEVMYWNKQINIGRRTGLLDVPLSEREKEILQLLWEEKSNKEIAGQLYLSVRSIEKIRQDMKEKLQVKSTVGLLKYAIEKRIISTNGHVAQDFYSFKRSG